MYVLCALLLYFAIYSYKNIYIYMDGYIGVRRCRRRRVPYRYAIYSLVFLLFFFINTTPTRFHSSIALLMLYVRL